MKITKTWLKQLIKEEMENIDASTLPLPGGIPGGMPDIPNPGELKELICNNKKIIFTALDHPSMAMYLVKNLGTTAEVVEGIVSMIEKIAGVKIEEILRDPAVKQTIKGAIEFACMF